MSAQLDTLEARRSATPVEQALDVMFRDGRTHNQFIDKPVPEALLRRLYDGIRWGPTSMNCQPMRVKLFVTHEKRQALSECVYPGNRAKVLGAPVCAVIGMDLDFPATLRQIFPHKTDAQAYYAGKPELVERTALRNSSMQAAYVVMAARLLGLDCGPMSGFDQAKVDALCWQGTRIETNMLCNLGYGDPSTLFARSPRFTFEEVWNVE